MAKRKGSKSVALLTEEPSYLGYELARIQDTVDRADRWLRSPVSSEVALLLRPLENPWDLYLAPLKHWPSSLIPAFELSQRLQGHYLSGAAIVFHPFFQIAIDRLMLEARRGVAFLNPPERVAERIAERRLGALSEEERERLLKDEEPSLDADAARDELARIFRTRKRGRLYPNKYGDLRRLARFESLLRSSKLSEKSAKIRLANAEGLAADSFETSLSRGRDFRKALEGKRPRIQK